MAELTIIEAIRSAIVTEMDRDERVMVLGLDVGRLGGVFRSTDGLIQKFGRKRIFDTPLAEASIIGSAIGLAISGLVPIAEIQFLGFTAQAFHQMGPQLGRFRYRSRGRYPLQVTVRAPMGGGTRTPEFHPDAMEALYVQSPALKVVMPSNPYDAKGMLIEAIRDPDPVLFIEPERLYRKGRAEVPDEAYTVPFGKARIARKGSDLTMIAWSAAVEVCEQAAEQLAVEGISVEVIDLRTLVPLDSETMTQSVMRTGRAVVVHEAMLSAGFGAEVVATLQEECFFSLDAPVARVASYDTPYPPSSMEEAWLPSPGRVVAAVRRTLGVSGNPSPVRSEGPPTPPHAREAVTASQEPGQPDPDEPG